MSNVTITRAPVKSPIKRIEAPNIFKDKVLSIEPRAEEQVLIGQLRGDTLLHRKDMLDWARAVVEMLTDE